MVSQILSLLPSKSFPAPDGSPASSTPGSPLEVVPINFFFPVFPFSFFFPTPAFLKAQALTKCLCLDGAAGWEISASGSGNARIGVLQVAGRVKLGTGFGSG